MFRGYAGLLRFRPDDGLRVLVRGNVSLYPRVAIYSCTFPRWSRGTRGTAARAHQLKAVLAAEGLFAAERNDRCHFSRVALAW
jgi:exodeoxyribonuclease VII large subunit